MRQTVLERLACVSVVCIVNAAWATEAERGRIEIEKSGSGCIITNVNRK